MHVGEKISVDIDSYDERGVNAKIKTVSGRVEYVHPDGRYAVVRVPAGYTVTVYPERRGGN